MQNEDNKENIAISRNIINSSDNIQLNNKESNVNNKSISTYGGINKKPIIVENKENINASMAYEIAFGSEKNEVNGEFIDNSKLIPLSNPIPLTLQEKPNQNTQFFTCDPITQEPILVHPFTNGMISEIMGNSSNVSKFKGVTGCKNCSGNGFRVNKSSGKLKPCRYCVRITGDCGLCNNTGFKLSSGKKCRCYKLKKQ